MELNVNRYSGQTYYAFSKLAELFFEKEKLHNLSLVVRLRVLLFTLEYEEKPKIDIAEGVFKLGILLKRSRFFTSAHTDQQLLKEVQDAIRDRRAKEYLPSLIQLFTSYFKRRNSITSQMLNISLLLDIDLSIKQSKMQY